MNEVFDSMFFGAGVGAIAAALFIAFLWLGLKLCQAMDWIDRIPAPVLLVGIVSAFAIRFFFYS